MAVLPRQESTAKCTQRYGTSRIARFLFLSPFSQQRSRSGRPSLPHSGPEIPQRADRGAAAAGTEGQQVPRRSPGLGRAAPRLIEAARPRSAPSSHGAHSEGVGAGGAAVGGGKGSMNNIQLDEQQKSRSEPQSRHGAAPSPRSAPTPGPQPALTVRCPRPAPRSAPPLSGHERPLSRDGRPERRLEERRNGCNVGGCEGQSAAC
ncbi:translation initiation factor IF-2-like [Coturnix japonica]|uniref:translation initiation factor IF-2-like n=1 Tax=Coturnix japonica TaxID=93934 RepID=UPI0013A5BDE9|nr:translation initiation factor IF-2-like [Coturnix japonica]